MHRYPDNGACTVTRGAPLSGVIGYNRYQSTINYQIVSASAAAATGQFQTSESLLLYLLGLHRLQELNQVFDPSKVLEWAC